jgi:hypothetical protein
MNTKSFPTLSLLSATMVLALGVNAANAAPLNSTGNNFTMLDATSADPGAAVPTPHGGIVDGTNDVTAAWDGTYNTSAAGTNFNMTLFSPTPFYGDLWTAHHIRVFQPGTYVINTTCSTTDLEGGTCAASGNTAENYTLVVGAGQIGAHMLFDWSVTSDIDVIQVWDVNAAFAPSPMALGGTSTDDAWSGNDSTVWTLMSRDIDGDGTNGAPMIDGPFIGFNANFNIASPGYVPPGEGTSKIMASTASEPGKMPTGGCSISSSPTGPIERGDWWIVAGFLAWLGALRFKRQAKS